MLDMPGWEGSQLIVKSRIELGFTKCPSQSRQNQAFYNEVDASIDTNSAMAVKENAVIVKFSNSLLAAPILFLLPARSLQIFISPFLLTQKDMSCLLSFHLKTAKGSLQSIILSFLNQLTKMRLGSKKTSLKAG